MPSSPPVGLGPAHSCGGGFDAWPLSLPVRQWSGARRRRAAASASSVVTILSSYGTFCTATAITRDLLLTAGHCVEPDGAYKLADTVPGQVPVLKDVVRTTRHPQFDIKRLFSHLATADVALLKLAGPAPARVTPARLGDAGELVAVGDTLTVAGIGVTAHGANRLDGLVHTATLTVTGHPSSFEIRLFDPATKGASAGLGACTGDSGAPAFRDGERRPGRASASSAGRPVRT